MNIVIFFGKERGNNNPFDVSGKKDTYTELVSKLSASSDLYVSSGYNNFLGENKFRCQIYYSGGGQTSVDRVIKADFVYDRSGELSFPPITMRNVLNPASFKLLCSNKWLQYQAYSEFFPKSLYLHKGHPCADLNQFASTCVNLVIKPLNGKQGTGIEFFKSHETEKIRSLVEESVNEEYILQEFRDTSNGIEGIAPSRHDLRLVFIGSNLIFTSVRQPKNSSTLLANVAQGGSIQDVSLEQLPKDLLSFITPLASKIKKDYGDVFYSLDVGKDQKGYFLFEFNDQIGFPFSFMESRTSFIKHLTTRILDHGKYSYTL